VTMPAINVAGTIATTAVTMPAINVAGATETRR
jgi:hypothetical protein